MFDEFSARITLHLAHLAHSLGKSTEALARYTVASTLSEAGGFVDVAAVLGRAELLIGLFANPPAPSIHLIGENGARQTLPTDMKYEGLLIFGSRAVRLTKGMGGTLEAAGKVIQAAISAEILRAKWGFVCILSVFCSFPPGRT